LSGLVFSFATSRCFWMISKSFFASSTVFKRNYTKSEFQTWNFRTIIKRKVQVCVCVCDCVIVCWKVHYRRRVCWVLNKSWSKWFCLVWEWGTCERRLPHWVRVCECVSDAWRVGICVDQFASPTNANDLHRALATTARELQPVSQNKTKQNKTKQSAT
jgi:hypothetical protein